MRRIITAVLGIPVRPDGKFLLSQRHAPENAATHAKWQLVGGGMEFGETPEQTLAREFQEEIQCAVTLLHPHPIVKISLWDDPNTNPNPDTHLVLMSYLVAIGDQKPNVSGDEETSAVRWVTLEEALQLPVLPKTHEFLLDAQQLVEHFSLPSTPPLRAALSRN